MLRTRDKARARMSWQESCSHHLAGAAHESKVTMLRELLPRNRTSARLHDYSKYIGYSHYQ